MTDRTTPAIADIDRCIATIENSTKRWSGNADYRRFLETELFCLREVRARLSAPARDAFTSILSELQPLISEASETRDRCAESDPNDQQGAATKNAYLKGLNKAKNIVLQARKAAILTPTASDGQ